MIDAGRVSRTDRSEVSDGRPLDRVVNHQLAVQVQTVAVIRLDADAVVAYRRCGDRGTIKTPGLGTSRCDRGPAGRELLARIWASLAAPGSDGRYRAQPNTDSLTDPDRPQTDAGRGKS